MATLRNTSQLIHEYNDKGQHRIVRVNTDSTNECSDWVDVHTLAQLGKNLAHGGSVDSALPPGIFTLREVPHQVLA